MHMTADVGVTSSINAAFEQILQSMSRIDILINNAGVEQPYASLDVTEALWDRILDTNLRGAFFCAQEAARRMAAASLTCVRSHPRSALPVPLPTGRRSQVSPA
jgi:NAD(P)-dependent dehydrogenase (short-subunit alcohol dehydrogenase family)